MNVPLQKSGIFNFTNVYSMSKVDKKKAKLEERIEYLQEQMKSNLGKKTHDTAELIFLRR